MLSRWLLAGALVALAACEQPAASGGSDGTNTARQGILFTRDMGAGTHVYSMAADGSRAVQLTADGTVNHCGRWSPDGRQIVLVSSRDTVIQGRHQAVDAALYVMNADGSNRRRVTQGPEPVGCADWSPDGRRLVFQQSDVAYTHANLYVINTDGTGRTRLTNHAWDESYPQWSPDGRTILYDDNREGWARIRIVNADGTGERTVASACVYNQYNPAWSPDGSRIAFDCDGSYGTTVHTIRTDGSDERQVSAPVDATHYGYDNSPVWSPDGTRLVIGRNSVGDMDLYTVATDGTGAIRLTSVAGWEAASDWR